MATSLMMTASKWNCRPSEILEVSGPKAWYIDTMLAVELSEFESGNKTELDTKQMLKSDPRMPKGKRMPKVGLGRSGFSKGSMDAISRRLNRD